MSEHPVDKIIDRASKYLDILSSIIGMCETKSYDTLEIRMFKRMVAEKINESLKEIQQDGFNNS